MINFKEQGHTVLYVGSQRLWLLHASGITQKIMKLPFTGRLQLEGQAEERDEFLLWKQNGHIFTAINRFNVVHSWNTLTGQLLFRKSITSNKKI